ncbi:MAG: SDR family oxidoreductase [Geminicoccaceae bacterium]
MAAHGHIDILVNNAGIARITPALDTPDEEWRQIMDVNVNGVFWCARAFGRHMVEHGSGSIVNWLDARLIVNGRRVPPPTSRARPRCTC